MKKIVSLVFLLIVLLSLLLPAPAAAAYSVIDTGITSNYYGWQHHSFYEWGMQWEFYCKSGNIYYRTTEDGLTWSNSTLVCASPNLQSFSIDWSDPYLSYARGDGGTNKGVLYYRRGAPQSDGSITWSAAEQSRWWDNNVWIQTTSIAVDSYGFPWVSIYYDNGTTTAGNLMAHGQTNDGTWGAAFGFDSYFSGGFLYPGHTLSSCGSGKLVWLCAKNSSVLAAKVYNGSSWEALKYSTVAVKDWYSFGVGNVGAVVDVVYLSNTGWHIWATTFYCIGAGSWGTDNWVTLADLSASSVPIIEIDEAHGFMVCIYAGAAADTLYYQSNYYGSWSSPVLFHSDTGIVNTSISCAEDTVSTLWGMYYLTAGGSLRFQYLEVPTGCPVPAVDTATDITSTSAVLNAHVESTGNSSCTGNMTLIGGNATYTWDVSGNLTADATLTIYATGLIPDTMYTYYLTMRGSGNCTWLQWSGASHFETLVCSVPVAPVVMTRDASNIGSTSAVINGRLIDDGCLPCVGGFFWRKVGDPSWIESWSRDSLGNFIIYRSYHASTDTGNPWVTGTLSGLLPDTTYEFKFEAKNAIGTTVGLVYEFTTGLPGVTPPSATTPPGVTIPGIPWTLTANVKIVIALIVTLGMMFLLGIKSPKQSAGIIVVAAGAVCVVGFTIFGWYPPYVIILIGGAIGLLILISVGKKGG